MLNRRDILKLQAGLGLSLLTLNEVKACPPPKYKVGQLVELKNGIRLFVIKTYVRESQNFYELALYVNGPKVLGSFEGGIVNVAK